MSAFVRQHGGPCAFASDQSWVILSPIEQSIKAKIERIGTPLKDWDVQIYRGILTGCNEAFIIGEERRKEILSWCTSETERTRTDGIIRPILRGRDIKRYGYDWANLYILALFPARHYDIEDYPALKRHLLSYAKDALIEGGRPDLAQEPFLSHFCRAKLEQSGQPVRIGGQTVSLRKRDGSTEPQKARKRTANKWFETQDAIAYWDDFSKPKIVWIELSDEAKFTLWDGALVNTAFFLSGKHVEYVLGILNSKLARWYFGFVGTSSGVGTLRWLKYTIETLPVVHAPLQDMVLLSSLVRKRLKCTERTRLTTEDEQIDRLVCALYDLTADEQEFVLQNR